MIPLPVNIHRMDIWTKEELPPLWKHLVWAQFAAPGSVARAREGELGAASGPPGSSRSNKGPLFLSLVLPHSKQKQRGCGGFHRQQYWEGASRPCACIACSRQKGFSRTTVRTGSQTKTGSPSCPHKGRTWKQTTGSFQKDLDGPTAAHGLTRLAPEPRSSCHSQCIWMAVLNFYRVDYTSWPRKPGG